MVELDAAERTVASDVRGVVSCDGAMESTVAALSSFTEKRKRGGRRGWRRREGGGIGGREARVCGRGFKGEGRSR